MNSGGIRSGRVDRICPSLQNVGPSSSRASRIRLAWRSRPIVPSASGRPNSSFSPCLAKTVAIFEPRAIRCGSVSATGAPERRTDPAVAAGIAVVTPSVVLTMITVQRALWLIRLGTLPSRNSLRPGHARVPHDQHIDLGLLGRPDDRHRGVGVDHDVRRGRGRRRAARAST